MRLFNERKARNRDLTEALEQQTATSEILRVISSSPTDLQPVFEAIVASAARLCEATFAALHRFDGQVVTFEAHHGMTEPEVEGHAAGSHDPPTGISPWAARSWIGRSLTSTTSGTIRNTASRSDRCRFGPCWRCRCYGRIKPWRDGPVAARGPAVL